MNLRLPLLAVLLAAAPCLALGPTEPPELASGPQASDFRRTYQQAMRINAVEEMGRLIRRNDQEAVLWIIEVCEAISERSSEELEATLGGLRVGWEKGMETGFVDKVYTYFSLLSAPLRRERIQLRARFEKARVRYHENVTAKDGPAFGLLALEFRALAAAFEELGDHYFASQTWLLFGLCHSEENRGPQADLYEACRGYKASLDAREAIELKDRFYQETRQSYTHLVSQGFGARPDPEGEAGGGAGPAGGGVASEAGPAVRAAMRFELLPRLEALERPNYHADDFYQMWDALSFQGRGTQATFTKLEGLSPAAVRRGDSQVVIQVEGPAGKAEIELPLTGKLEPVRFEIGSGEERRPWAALTTLGIQNDQYQNVQINLAPSTDYLSVYWLNAGSMVGEVGGVRVQVLDDNLDGIYGSPPRTWQSVGLTEGLFQPEMDSLVVGTEKRARPWSEFTKLGETWYRLEVERGGQELVATPTEVQTGFLSLDYSGPTKPTWLIVQGAGRWENSFFDLAAARGKGAEVPVGRYTLYYGEMRKGRRAQAMKTLILPGKNAQRYDVRPGEVTKVSMGAPYSFDFKFKASGGELVVPGRSVVVVGSAGERYERPWNAVASPEVSWREKGSRRSSKLESMPGLLDTDPIYEQGFGVAWFPRDLQMPLPHGAGEIEVQLSERKHRFFGKIESDWRE